MTPFRYALVFAVIGGAAIAQDAPMVEDADGNGTYSKEELMAVYPEITDEIFVSIDANADGAVDADELATAVDAGTLTAG